MNCSLRGSISFRMTGTLGQHRFSIKESTSEGHHEKLHYFMGHWLVIDTVFFHTLITGQGIFTKSFQQFRLSKVDRLLPAQAAATPKPTSPEAIL